MPFLETNSQMTTKPYNCDIKCESNSASYNWHGFFGTKFRGGQSFLLTVGSFFNKREYSEANWLATLILLVSSLLVYHYSTRSQSAPACAIASTVFTGADR